MNRHAGIYTTEEVVQITKQKMQRLQELYIDQVYRLQHLLKEKRRKYLHGLRIEKESLCKWDFVKKNPITEWIANHLNIVDLNFKLELLLSSDRNMFSSLNVSPIPFLNLQVAFTIR